jgi:DNA-binding CsgD family transcriptional regulator
MTSYEVGEHLFIEVATVKSHLKHILDKMGAKNRAHAVALAYHGGLLVPKTKT